MMDNPDCILCGGRARDLCPRCRKPLCQFHKEWTATCQLPLDLVGR